MRASSGAEVVSAAVEHARALGTARIALALGERPFAPLTESTDAVRHPLRRLAGWVVEAATASMAGEGVIDFAERRYMVNWGSYAEVYRDGELRGGREGRSLASLSVHQPASPTPFLVLDLLAAVTDSHDLGPDDVRESACRHLVIELGRTRLPLTFPSRWSEDLDRMRPEVWISDGSLRRVEVVAEGRSHALELWDLGTDVDVLDWTRLPELHDEMTL
jgi:hypothetical protein